MPTLDPRKYTAQSSIRLHPDAILISVQGWSYGGYLSSSMCPYRDMENGNKEIIVETAGEWLEFVGHSPKGVR